MRAKKLQRRALQLPRTACALRHGDHKVATMRHRDADRGMARATGHIEVIISQAPRHVGNPNGLARRKRRKAFADQIEIGNAIDFVVIGNTGVTVAETDFWPHIKLGLRPACGRIAAEGAAGRPAVARKRPGDFLPMQSVRFARQRVVNPRNGRQGGNR